MERTRIIALCLLEAHFLGNLIEIYRDQLVKPKGWWLWSTPLATQPLFLPSRIAPETPHGEHGAHWREATSLYSQAARKKSQDWWELSSCPQH